MRVSLQSGFPTSAARLARTSGAKVAGISTQSENKPRLKLEPISDTVEGRANACARQEERSTSTHRDDNDADAT